MNDRTSTATRSHLSLQADAGGERVLVSPITAIVQDVRKRNVTASASFSSSTGNLSSTAADPWEEMDAAGGCGPWGKEARHIPPAATTAECKCRTMRRRMSSAWKSPCQSSGTLRDASENSRVGAPAAPSNVCSYCAKRRSKLKTFAWSASHPTDNAGHKSQISDEPQHADALLQATPQLRFLSPASTDMQGAGKVHSHNLVSFVIHAAVEGTAHLKDGFIESSTMVTAGGGHAEYRASMLRDHANELAASELTSLLWVLAHEMSLENFGTVENQVFTAVFAMVHSTIKELRMAGVAAIDALVVAPSADEERKAIKFANTLSNGLRTAKGDFEFLSAVSKALGHMAKRTANVDFVESEVTRGLEWLQTERSDRRFVLLLSRIEPDLSRSANTRVQIGIVLGVEGDCYVCSNYIPLQDK
jgi:hypothetical protein